MAAERSVEPSPMRLALVALCLSASGCEHGDADRATSSPHERAPSPSIAKPAPPSLEPARVERRCIVPLPASPPADAKPAPSCPPDPEQAPDLPRGRVRFVEAPGQPAVDVELARTETHRRRGLMYRTSLEQDRGMLFSWPSEAPRSFWMRNTCIPLDMLFIALDGTIVGVLEQVPTLNEAPRRIPCPAAHVLEVSAGWVRAHDVRPGQRIEIDS